MRLAMIITKVDADDSVYGANIAWIRALAKRVEHLTVVGMSVGRHELPPNATVHSLGKELGASRFRRLLKLQRIMLPLLLRRRVDGVFVHQGQIWGPLLFYARFRKIPLVLFKAHGTMPKSIHGFLPFFTKVTTTTPETFVNTPKKVVVGQGIDVHRFERKRPPPDIVDNGEVLVVSVGRLSPIRRYGAVIEAVAKLHERGRWRFSLHIYGEAYGPGEKAHAQHLASHAERLGFADRVHFHGAVPHSDLPDILAGATVYLSGSIGSSALDKSMLEAMACELPMITGNPKFAQMFGPYTDTLYCGVSDAAALADALERVLTLRSEERARMGAYLRKQVVGNHDVEGLMDQIVAIMAEVQGNRT